MKVRLCVFNFVHKMCSTALTLTVASDCLYFCLYLIFTHITFTELDHASSLERAAYTTLHLLQELQSSTEQVSAITMNTPAKNKAPDSGNNSSNILPSLNDTSSSGINGVIMEKSRFLMKLAPRIRRLESDTAKCLVGRLESLLVKVRTLMEEQQQLTNGNDLSSVGGDTIMSQNQHVQSEYKQKHSELLLTISHTLRGLAILNKGNEAQSTFARIAIMPIIKSKLSMGKLHEGGPRGECSGLFFLLDDIVTVVRSMYGDILRISEGMFTNTIDNNGSNKEGVIPMEIDLVTCGVWVPVATALTADPGIKMAIFSPGIANVLQANYSALDTFLSELAGSLLTPPSQEGEELDGETKTNENVELGDFSHLYYQPRLNTKSIENAQKRLYAHPTTVDYYKRWNLPIYYQLRFAEFTNRLDKALQRIQSEGWHADVYSGDESDAKKIRDELGLELPIFIELYDVILSMWKSTVFLRPLTHRFLRGAVQLVGRILAFVRAGLEGEIEFGGSSGDTAADSKRKGGDEDESSGAPSSSVVAMPSYFWNERVEDIAVVAWELTILDTTMSHDYLEAITNTVCPSDKESQESTHNSSSELDEIKLLASEILTESSRSISPIVSYSWNTLIVDNLTSQCCTPLSAVKGVAATYRMTNRPPPTQASPFVATILRPLQEFDKTFSSRTPPQIGDDWKRTVIATVSDKYSIAVEELIATVKRTEEALKSRKTRRMMAGGMSDGEKVKLQLFLDHKAFKTQVEELLGGSSVENEGITGLDKLGELTREAEALFEQTQK